MEELRKITEEELKKVLEEHEKWLKSKGEKGIRADLSATDLRHVNLSGADLRFVYLEQADLRYANLSYTNFRTANLIGSNLMGAYLMGSNLMGAYLYSADLRDTNMVEADLRNASARDADLTNADLRFADLRGTDFDNAVLDDARYFIPSVCPKEGSFIAWKKAMISKFDSCAYVIIKLLIPEDALRSSGTSRKCRASKAVVLDIQMLDGTPLENVTACSKYNFSFIYEIGKTVEPDSFDENRFNECSNGIHFFIDRSEAVEYGI